MMSTHWDEKEVPVVQVGARGGTATAGQKVSVVTKLPLLLPEVLEPLDVELAALELLREEVPPLLPPSEVDDVVAPELPELLRGEIVLWPQWLPQPCSSPDTLVEDAVWKQPAARRGRAESSSAREQITDRV
jgi:hypothetical protein